MPTGSGGNPAAANEGNEEPGVNFLGLHWSVLRLERGTGVLIHAPLDAGLDDGVDFSLDLPWPLTVPLGVAGQPDVMIEPASSARTVHITRGEQDLWADARSTMAVFRDRAAGRFEFLLLDVEELATLRRIRHQRWARGPSADGPEITVAPAEGFTLDLGIARLDLRQHRPHAVHGGHSVSIYADAGEITITPAGSPRDEMQMHKRAAAHAPPIETDLAAWRKGGDGWLEIAGADEFASLPMTVCDADLDWMYAKPFGGRDQSTGRFRCRTYIAREAGKYVSLSRYIEGLIFDEHGSCNEDGYLEWFGYRGAKPQEKPPDWIRYDHGRLYADRARLQDAPRIEGNTIVFIMGHLSNYTHWLIDSLLALHVLLEFTPPDARILLPGTLRTLRHAQRRVVDHADTLRAFGFSHLPVIESDAPFCLVEQAYWLQDGNILHMPATYLRAFRARVAALRPPPARRDGRIYIARRGDRRIVNAEMLAPFLERQGFTTHYMEDYSIDHQIDLFSEAEFVIGPHGRNWAICSSASRAPRCSRSRPITTSSPTSRICATS